MNKEQIIKRINEVYGAFPEENTCEFVDKFYMVLLEAFGNDRYNLDNIKEFILSTV